MENSETQSWIDFAHACNYLDVTVYKDLISKSEEIGRMLNHMVDHPEKYVRQKVKITEQ